mmetsp:Transcript_7672/g.28756  ORF Transcript_7672/g.28756 Transcript_7672/m.28756 type:complete len:312 (+) Transcript_7672:1585-2520(+)
MIYPNHTGMMFVRARKHPKQQNYSYSDLPTSLLNHSTASNILEKHNLDFSEFVNGITNSLPSNTAVFDSSIRHRIHSKRRYIVDDHASILQLIKRVVAVMNVVAENTRLQPVASVIGHLDSLFEALDFFDDAHWSKHFLFEQIAILTDISDNCWLENIALWLVTTNENLCSIFHSLLHPVVASLSIILRNERSNKGLVIEWISRFEVLRLFNEYFCESVENMFVSIDALHRDATLTALIECTMNESIGDVIEFNLLIHNARSISAQFENDSLLATLFLEFPSNLGRSSKGHARDALIGGEQVCSVTRTWKH